VLRTLMKDARRGSKR